MSVLCARSGEGGKAAPARRGKTKAAAPTTATTLDPPLPSLLTGTGNILLVKGAAECVLARCTHALLEDGSTAPLARADAARLGSLVDAMAARALRVLAVAVRVDELPGALAKFGGDVGADAAAASMLGDVASYPTLESGLSLVALIALHDPPRPEVAAAVARCGAAGVRVVVVTGDNRLTAEAICTQVGVFPPTGPPRGASITGRDFAALDAAATTTLLTRPGGLCVSRAEPAHKAALVRALKKTGAIVAMTGDGVNDAPALKLADIGIAMGISGTAVARGAADMVLADDNFASIVAAVEEGRAIYDNMKAFIRYMISSNVGEVASIFLTAALGLPEGLIPVQLLWVNLVTDGPPATALGFNPPDPGVMRRPPRPSNEDLLTPWLLFRWLAVGAYVGAATVGVLAAWYVGPPWLAAIGLDPSADGHTPLSWAQLTRWSECGGWSKSAYKAMPYTTAGGGSVAVTSACDMFSAASGKLKPATLSLTVLVAIEMLNALNALSEDYSLITVPPTSNPWLLAAMAVSLGLHALVLYTPPLARIFSVVPLSLREWGLVALFACPVVVVDEALKVVGRAWRTRDDARARPRPRARSKRPAAAAPAGWARGRRVGRGCVPRWSDGIFFLEGALQAQGLGFCTFRGGPWVSRLGGRGASV